MKGPVRTFLSSSQRRAKLVVAAFSCVVLCALSGGCPAVSITTGTSQAWVRHTIDASRDGADGVRLGDVNRDGLSDLVVAWEEEGEIVVYVNPGAALASGTWQSVRVGRLRNVEDALFVDLDGDGALDVVGCAEGDTKRVAVMWGPQQPSRLLDAGAWVAETLTATDGMMRWMFATAADIDGRNGIDLVLGGKDGNAAIGWLEAPADARDVSSWQWHPLRSVSWTMSVVAHDLDADGDEDIVASDRKGADRGVFWLENPGPGFATLSWREHPIGLPTGNMMFIDVGDADDDGRVDVLAASEARSLVLYRRLTEVPTSWSSVLLPLPDNAGTAKAVRLGDFDLDGRTDAAFTCENARNFVGVGWLPVSRIANFSYGPARRVSDEEGSKFDLVQAVDLDNDGDLDLITCEESVGLGVVWYENPTLTP